MAGLEGLDLRGAAATIVRPEEASAGDTLDDALETDDIGGIPETSEPSSAPLSAPNILDQAFTLRVLNA